MMKNLRASRGKFFIERLIAEGEHDRQDFKYTINDARKIARSLSAFANHRGGRLLIGVKDNGTVAGVRSEEDIYMIETAAQIYCRPEPSVTFHAYKANDEGAQVIVAEVAPSDIRPIYVQEDDGTQKAYIRVADENILAPELLVRAWRRQNSPQGSLLTLNAVETTVIDTIAASAGGMISSEQLIRTVKASRFTIEEAITKLAAIGTVGFRYHGGEFMLVLKDQSEAIG